MLSECRPSAPYCNSSMLPSAPPLIRLPVAGSPAPSSAMCDAAEGTPVALFAAALVARLRSSASRAAPRPGPGDSRASASYAGDSGPGGQVGAHASSSSSPQESYCLLCCCWVWCWLRGGCFPVLTSSPPASSPPVLLATIKHRATPLLRRPGSVLGRERASRLAAASDQAVMLLPPCASCQVR